MRYSYYLVDSDSITERIIRFGTSIQVFLYYQEQNMELTDILFSKESMSLNVSGNIVCNRYTYLHEEDSSTADLSNGVFALFDIDELIDEVVPEAKREFCHKNDFAFHSAGWQSWGFGGEVDPGKNEIRYIPLVPQWKQYIAFPGKAPKKVFGKNPKNKKILNGDFVIYFRWQDTYLVICSTGNVGNTGEKLESLPPVHYYADRKERSVIGTVYSDGKKWNSNEKVAEITVFATDNFFALKACMESLYASDKKARFEELQFLNSSDKKILTGGWESWYNHYADINQTLIEEDLNYLGKTENLIKKQFRDGSKPCVFQVDDGWEQGLGQWDCNTDRFPEGMVKLAFTISEYGYIPGLWLAPFIIDWRTPFAKEHRDWILRYPNGKPIPAGMAFLWGDKFGKNQPSWPWSYYCLDLSRDDVLEYLDGLMDKVINEWGFRYLKLDFLFAGLIYGDYANGGAGYKWYERAIKTLTKRKVNNKGQSVIYLGCGVPFEPSYTSFPLSRIGSDTKEAWDAPDMAKINWTGRPGAVINMQSTLGHSFWDQGVFINDPDVVFLRYENITLTDTEKETVALVNYLFASQIMHSDDPVHFDAEREGAFTSHISSLYETFKNEEFGLRNVTQSTYIIFNKAKTYAGFINLLDDDAVFEKDEILNACGVEKAAFEAIVSHAEEADLSFKAEPHSISIYKI